MELGRHIRQYRTERGLSQEDLADKIYVSRQTVSNWETDKTYPDIESLVLLSVFFDVTVDDLIKGDVEAMKEALSKDWKKMCALNLGGLVIALAGAVLAVAGIAYWDWDVVPSALIGLLVWGIGMAMIMTTERIKKQHDLVTYRELVAFSKGEPVDRNNPHSQKARQHRVLKIAIVTVIAAILGAILGYYSYALGWIG